MNFKALFAVAFTVIGLSVAGVQASAAAPSKSEMKKPNIVAVQEGDNLSMIAAAHESTYERIFFANSAIEDPNIVFAGQELRIPTAEENLTPREIPVAVQAVASYQPAEQYAGQVAVSQPAAAVAPTGGVWDQLAQCESGGNWSINTGNGYQGGLQFSPGTWAAHGGVGSASGASREQQIAVAQSVQSSQGWGAWPACSSKLGLR